MVTYKWNITIAKDHFISTGQVIEAVREAIPVRGEVEVQEEDGSLVLSVPSQVETREKVETLLVAAGIPASVRLLRPAK